MDTLSPPRFPALASPIVCLQALPSPVGAQASPPLSIGTARSSYRPSPIDTLASASTASPSPVDTPLPDSPVYSPKIAGEEGDIGFRDVDPAPRGSVLFAGDGTSPVVVELAGLDVEDRAQMDELMGLGSSKAACEMASEVIGIILPALPKGQGFSSTQRAQATVVQDGKVAEALRLWLSLTPSPLVSLIVTVILLERLAEKFPAIGAAGSVILHDAPLRLTFAAFLLSMKWTCDVSHMNASFVRYTPWSLADINRMERELLGCLEWDVYVSAKELLHRAAGFWKEHEAFIARSHGSDAGDVCPTSELLGNYFLMKKRPGMNREPLWKGGLMRPTAEGGRRMSAPYGEHGGEGAQMGDGGEGVTVWREGRLERTGSVRSLRAKSVSEKSEARSSWKMK